MSLGKGQAIPTRIYLLDIRNRVAYEAEVAWSRPPEYGLSFLKALPLAEISDPNLEYLRRLWVACAAR